MEKMSDTHSDDNNNNNNSSGGSGSGFSVFLDKKTSSNSDFLSWMKLQQSSSTQPFPCNFLMMGVDFHGGGTALLPTNNSGGSIEAAHYQLDGADAGNFGNNTSILQQPFHIVHPSYSLTTPYKSPAVTGEGGMAFTAAQRKELERQAMIYKCMISSVPVPPHLSTNFPVDSSVYGGRYSRKGDPEPGRCKRTDGKKWRCSKEVAPLQKYCERHLHRGRPRSRKPVELNNNNKKKKKTTKSTASQSHPLVPATKTDLTISTPYYKVFNPTTNTTKREASAWEMNYWANEDYSSSSFDEDYAVRQQALALNLFSYPEMDRLISFSPSLNPVCGEALQLDNIPTFSNL